MKISNNPPQHLSNHEVLQHFLALKADNDYLEYSASNYKNRQILKAHEQLPFVKRDRNDRVPELPEVASLSKAELQQEKDAARRGVSKELVWVQDEVLKYLCADCNVTARQTLDGVALLADQLQDYGLTKAELLQVCNLAPRSIVGLYLIIEECETRMPQPYEDTMGTIISDYISPSVLPEVPEEFQPFVSTVHATDIAQTIMDDHAEYAEDEGMEYQDEEEFIHEAEWGAGREAAVDDEADETMD